MHQKRLTGRIRVRDRVTFAANASGDLDLCEVRVSPIPGAGLGLFATCNIKKGQVITKYKYSDTSISAEDISKSS